MTTQVKPLSSGSFTSISLSSSGQAKKDTTFGVTLTAGYTGQALQALNQWRNARGTGTAPGHAQKVAKAVGLQIQEI